MTADRGRRSTLRVEADLDIQVAGTSAHLGGHGDRLTLTCADPDQLWAAVSVAAAAAPMGSDSGPRAVGRLADELTAAGLGLEVVGPHGTMVRLGQGVHSLLGRAATGSYAVRPGTPSAVVSVFGRRQRRTGAAVGIGALLAGLGAGIAARTRSRRH